MYKNIFYVTILTIGLGSLLYKSSQEKNKNKICDKGLDFEHFKKYATEWGYRLNPYDFDT